MCQSSKVRLLLSLTTNSAKGVLLIIDVVKELYRMQQEQGVGSNDAYLLPNTDVYGLRDMNGFGHGYIPSSNFTFRKGLDVSITIVGAECNV